MNRGEELNNCTADESKIVQIYQWNSCRQSTRVDKMQWNEGEIWERIKSNEYRIRDRRYITSIGDVFKIMRNCLQRHS